MRTRAYVVGDMIGGMYRVLRIFGGAGVSGMGIVYLVEARDAPKPFVLKACQSGDPTLTFRFKREAEVWVNIGSHPNIAKAIWVRHLDEQMFVAAEYVSGAEGGFGSLADIAGLDVGLHQIIRWAMQFCSGLAHAVARGMVAHRDIKPANLLLTRDGYLKISDFGLGKTTHVSTIGANRSAIATTGIAGTLPYMAPEQMLGTATDHRCDIYAFGIVLYEVSSGGAYPYAITPPVDEGSFISAHLRGVARPLATPLWPVIDKCLARSASDRWRSPEELAVAVREVAEQMSLPCPPFVGPQPVGLEELYAKAQSLSALGRGEDALVAIQQYLAEAPEAFWAWTEKGRILVDLKRDAEAEEATRRSLALDPSNTHAWNNLGVILQRLSRYEESCVAHDRALECDPLNTGAVMNIAQSLCGSGRYERAATTLCLALKLAPAMDGLIFNTGNLVGSMLQARAFKPAEQVSRALLDVDSQNSQAWHNLGVILAAKGNRKEGLDCVRCAVQYQPNNADSRLLLAKLCAEEGCLAEATTHLNRLIADRQHLSKSVCFKAQLLSREGQRRDAIALLESYLENAPTDDAAWFVLCLIAESEGDTHKALRAALAAEKILQRQGLQANPHNVQLALDKVGELRVSRNIRGGAS